MTPKKPNSTGRVIGVPPQGARKQPERRGASFNKAEVDRLWEAFSDIADDTSSDNVDISLRQKFERMRSSFR